MKRTFGRAGLAAGMLVAATMLVACTSTVAGIAEPVPGQGPVVRNVDVCALLTPDQAKQAGLTEPGMPTEAEPERLVPAGCIWHPSDPTRDTDVVAVVYADDLSLDQYLSGAQPGEQFALGGLTWTRYADPFGEDHCNLDVPLGDTSFVGVSSSDLQSETAACDYAKAVAPLVAANLPGKPH